MQFHITPNTRIMDIIQEYPESEDILITIVPVFSKLKNPVLRNTIGKMATIEQAAKIGEISISLLINQLNEKLGLIPISDFESISETALNWDIKDKIVIDEIDADRLIENGEKPVSVLLGSLSRLNQNEIVKLNCSFYPSPLLDKAKEKGFEFIEFKNEDYSRSFYFRRLESV